MSTPTVYDYRTGQSLGDPSASVYPLRYATREEREAAYLAPDRGLTDLAAQAATRARQYESARDYVAAGVLERDASALRRMAIPRAGLLGHMCLAKR